MSMGLAEAADLISSAKSQAQQVLEALTGEEVDLLELERAVALLGEVGRHLDDEAVA